ncbi:hypothetical protein ACLKA6_003077 [Drosophila palustris]
MRPKANDAQYGRSVRCVLAINKFPAASVLLLLGKPRFQPNGNGGWPQLAWPIKAASYQLPVLDSLAAWPG